MNKNQFKALLKTDSVSMNSLIIRSLFLLSTTISQLILPVIFLKFSNLSNLGLWTLVISTGSFAAILDLGLIQVMITAAIKEISLNKMNECRRILNLLFNFLIYILLSVLILLLLFQTMMSIGIDVINTELITLMCLSFLNFTLGLLVRYFEGSFRAMRKLTGLKNLVFLSYCDLIILCANLIYGSTFFSILFQMIGLKSFVISLQIHKFQSNFFAFTWMRPSNLISDIRNYLSLGISFLAMPLGYLTLNEVSNIIIGSLLGLQTLGLFVLLKSISGVFRQVSGIFTASLQPRFTELIYSGKEGTALKLFKRIRFFLVLINSLLLVILLLVFDFFVKLVPSLGLVGFITYSIFLICVYLDIFWLIESSIIFSINAHKSFSLRFFLSAIISCAIGGFLTMEIGLAGMILGTLLIDLVLIPFSVRERRGILNDKVDEKLT